MISFDVFALSPQGYEVHFQIQAEDKVYETAAQLLAKLALDGFTVRGKALQGPGKATNGHHPIQSTPNGQKATTEASSGHWCQAHQTDYKRFSKGDQVWYSHKTEDGWCKEGGK